MRAWGWINLLNIALPMFYLLKLEALFTDTPGCLYEPLTPQLQRAE
jgi:hypothetical protein